MSVNWLTTSAAPPTSSSERSKLPVVVLEDPQSRDLAGERALRRLVVVAGDPEEDAEALADRAARRGARARDALDDRSHSSRM